MTIRIGIVAPQWAFAPLPIYRERGKSAGRYWSERRMKAERKRKTMRFREPAAFLAFSCRKVPLGDLPEKLSLANPDAKSGLR